MLIFFISPPIQSGDLNMRDLLFQIRGEADLSHSDIVIVEISQQADAEIPYKYPWPTSIYAKLIENLNRAGARAIAFDVMFDQPDLYDARNDAIFARAVEEAGNVVFIGGFRRQADVRAGSFLIENVSPVFPRQELLDATPWNIGFVDMRRDIDGSIRTYPLQINHRGIAYYSLALKMMPLALQEDVEYINQRNHYSVAGRRFSKTTNSRILINYYGPYRSFDYIGLESVVDDEEFVTVTESLAFEVNEFDHPEYGLLSRGVLNDKIVLIGATMPELQDFHQVPFPNSSGEKTMAGVEIHAHLLQNLIDGEFISELTPFQNLMIVFAVLIATFLITYYYIGWGGFIAAIGLGIFWLLVSIFAFLQLGLFLPILSTFLAILLGYTGSTLQNVLFEVKEKKKIKSMFSTYLSPELVDKMVADDVSYKLGGRLEYLTVLFSDIEDFTLLSEIFEPEELVGLINRYLDNITGHINSNSGTLDKYIGDAVMAIYGAPFESNNHASDACRTVLMSRFIWTDKLLEEKSLQIKTRFGINTGEMLVGNMGSNVRFNYTVMGDQVNIAARCETAGKIFGVYAIVSESTKDEANREGEFVFRRLGRVRVKGKREPIDLYQLICFSLQASNELEIQIANFENALDLFYNRHFEEAHALFSKVKEYEESLLLSDSYNNPSMMYIKLCKNMLKDPPDESWRGVVEG